MADFRGEFDWLKKILENDHSGFAGRIGYEENSHQAINVLDVLALLTLFHPTWDDKDANGVAKAPVVAYANRGRMDARLSDEELTEGYMELGPLTLDILKLHDHVYAQFEQAYDAAFGKRSRLSRRKGVVVKEHKLPITGAIANFELPGGYVFPVLAALRALVYRRGGGIKWRRNPFEFFDKHGPALVAELMEQVDAVGGEPNAAGKRKLVYTALHDKAKLALQEEISGS